MCTSSENTIACVVTISSLSVSGIRSALRDLFDPALHVEVSFGHLVVFALEDFLEAADGVGDCDLPSFASGEDLRGTERLAEKALDLPRPEHRELVVRRQLVHPQD